MQENPKDWTDQETLLLLEGLEMYNDNWKEIAEHVGTKTQASTLLYIVIKGSKYISAEAACMSHRPGCGF